MSDKYYITNLDWGDGTEREFTGKPKGFYGSLELFEHVYEKPGFYTISGLVFTKNNGRVESYEKFKSNIVVNPSPKYDSPFFEDRDFAMIGGYTEDSTYFKTLAIIAGYDFEKNKRVNLHDLNYNEFDVIHLLDVLHKFDSNLYDTILDNYSNEIYDGDTLIHNNYSSKKHKDILKNTGLNNVDIGSCKMYNGVRKMHKHLGFNNSHPAADSNNEMYWNNIIPKGWKWTDREGIEYGVFREPIFGSKALVEEFKEYKIDDSASQDWTNGYWPVLPKINKAGKFISEVTSSYGHSNVAV